MVPAHEQRVRTRVAGGERRQPRRQAGRGCRLAAPRCEHPRARARSGLWCNRRPGREQHGFPPVRSDRVDEGGDQLGATAASGCARLTDRIVDAAVPSVGADRLCLRRIGVVGIPLTPADRRGLPGLRFAAFEDREHQLATRGRSLVVRGCNSIIQASRTCSSCADSQRGRTDNRGGSAGGRLRYCGSFGPAVACR
jgi:hypothetical protein